MRDPRNLFNQTISLILLYIMMHAVSSLRKLPMRGYVKVMSRFVSENRIEAYNHAKESKVIMPCIILVNPFLEANVGSVSRCMLNFGMHELRVVNPRCDILSETAQTLAVGSVEILKNAKIFTSLEDCVADLDLVVATTARKHSINQIVYTPREMASEVVNHQNSHNVGIMFGRERDGLNNEELALANRRVGIPTFEHYGVLNMAQAVNIIGYECWQQALSVRNGAQKAITVAVESNTSDEPDSSGDGRDTERPATAGELNHFLDRLLQNVGNSERNIHSKAASLDSINEDDSSLLVNPKGKTVSGFDVKNEDRIKAIFRRANLNKRELRIMQGVVTRLVK